MATVTLVSLGCSALGMLWSGRMSLLGPIVATGVLVMLLLVTPRLNRRVKPEDFERPRNIAPRRRLHGGKVMVLACGLYGSVLLMLAMTLHCAFCDWNVTGRRAKTMRQDLRPLLGDLYLPHLLPASGDPPLTKKSRIVSSVHVGREFRRRETNRAARDNTAASAVCGLVIPGIMAALSIAALAYLTVAMLGYLLRLTTAWATRLLKDLEKRPPPIRPRHRP